ncbi:MAG: HAD family hydrolase [Anaerolineales bacterium]|nr:HAD family hydrolase [Anaerolineales bacterium]
MNAGFEKARIKAILFDIDGTLANTDDDYIKHLSTLLAPLQFLFPGRNTLEIARGIVTRMETPANVIKAWLDRLYIDELIGAINDGVHSLSGRGANNQLTLIEGIRPMLEYLYGSYPLAIVTAREHRSSMAFLRHYDLLHFFKCIVTARTTFRSKPHPAPVYHAAQELGVPITQCVMVGDTTVDMRAGSAAGAQTVGVLCGFGDREELLHAGADILLETTAEMANLLGTSFV